MKNIKIAVILGVLFVCPILAFSATIHVPGDQSTIQAGIDASAAGDTVLVAPGTYIETLTYPSHRLIVISSVGPDSTYITHPDSISSIVYISNSDSGSVFGGFTINNVTTDGYIIDVFSTQYLKISNNHFNDCTVTSNSCVINTFNAEYMEISNNQFIDCSGQNIIKSTRDTSGCAIIITYNLFKCSTTDYVVYVSGEESRFINNTIDGGYRGILMTGPMVYIRIGNNIFTNLTTEAIYDPMNYGGNYNCIWNCGPYYNPGLIWINEDPLFIDPTTNDYTLEL